jgi:hypothetical protein
MKRLLLLTVPIALVAACRGTSTTTVAAPQSGVFALEAEPAASGGEAEVRLPALSDAGSIVTVVGRLTYDPSQLEVKDCRLTATAPGKSLHWGKPSPGVVSAVVAGDMTNLPAPGDVIACSFAVAGKKGTTASVGAEGEVADGNLVDRRFSAAGTVDIN